MATTKTEVDEATQTTEADEADELEVNAATERVWGEFAAINHREHRFCHTEFENVTIVVGDVDDEDEAWSQAEAFLVQMGGYQSDQFATITIDRELHDLFVDTLGDYPSVRNEVKWMIRRAIKNEPPETLQLGIDIPLFCEFCKVAGGTIEAQKAVANFMADGIKFGQPVLRVD